MRNFIRLCLQELAGLFVDDGLLAIAICAIVAVSAGVAAIAPGTPLAAGAVLLVGCLAALLVNVLRQRNHRPFTTAFRAQAPSRAGSAARRSASPPANRG